MLGRSNASKVTVVLLRLPRLALLPDRVTAELTIVQLLPPPPKKVMLFVDQFRSWARLASTCHRIVSLELFWMTMLMVAQRLGDEPCTVPTDVEVTEQVCVVGARHPPSFA